MRPLPNPPRCRGVPLGDGHYRRCAYGDGELNPLAFPDTCPVCNGSGFEGLIVTRIPHSEFGGPDCGCCFNAVISGDEADIVCYECDTVVRTVPAADLQATLDAMELALPLCIEKCPHCKGVSVITGLSKVFAFKCRHCGELVKLSKDVNIERIFGTE